MPDNRPEPATQPRREPEGKNAVVDMGWGRLIFGHTFADAESLITAIRAEGPGRRDIAAYIQDPHVVLAQAPQELFLDPSHTYRLELTKLKGTRKPRGFTIRRLNSLRDADEVNRIFLAQKMVPVAPDFFWQRRDSRVVTCLVAEDDKTGRVIGTVMGCDHGRAFNDHERGSSLWCLAVDPQTSRPGIGEALVRHLAEIFAKAGAKQLDLSVLHDNEQAIALYEKLGFERLAVFTLKRKNPINEKLFLGPEPEQGLNPYAKLIVDEARRRGIGVEIIDAEGGFFRLVSGGRSVACRESLSELTSAVAMSLCDDKAVTRRILEKAGITVPAQMDADDQAAIAAFLEQHRRLVVKPARGEQGRGVAVGLATLETVEAAVAEARQHCDRVLIEAMAEGQDLRLVVIDYRVVAAAIRRPAHILGDGQSKVRDLIERQSRRRAAATGGESRIPLDAETERCLADSGYSLDDTPDNGVEIQVRKAANLHTGGTIHDVTDNVHPALVQAAVLAARTIEIPVVGIDFMVPSPYGPDYVFIEANERPGLANHEPQPTAERFVDLLFPLSMPLAARRHSGAAA
jgi:GNAT-family acetyltransferase (TIGR03103 family)